MSAKPITERSNSSGTRQVGNVQHEERYQQAVDLNVTRGGDHVVHDGPELGSEAAGGPVLKRFASRIHADPRAIYYKGES